MIQTLPGYRLGVALPVSPPVAPMLARLARELPRGAYLYEPKWDGFRCLAFRDGDSVDLRSRNDRPLARYFPEVVEALLRLPGGEFALDGELVVPTAHGLDFEALLARLHPAPSRVERLRRETPAALIAFDVLALEADLRDRPLRERRDALARLLPDARPPLFVSPATLAADEATSWLERFQGAGIDGVMAKELEGRYLAGKRAVVKVKHERTAECVVAGFRVFADRPFPSSLLLGLHASAGALLHVGIASGFAERVRAELLATLRPHVTPLAGHPWEHGFLVAGGPTGRLRGAAARWDPELMAQDWIPVVPELVCEVAYDQLDGPRFRHPGRFRRWRPDRDAASCSVEQLAAAPADPLELLVA